MIPTDWIGTFQLLVFLSAALGEKLFVVLWRLGAGEDPKQIGFWAEPSASPVSVGPLLFKDGFKEVVDGLLKLEAVFVVGFGRRVEGLFMTEGAFGKGGDVTVGEECRSIASIDVPKMVTCSASGRGGFMAVG